MFPLVAFVLVGSAVATRICNDVEKDPDYFVPDDRDKDFNGELNLTTSFFSKLRNYQVNAKRAIESEYLWLAKVIHSKQNMFPYMCTAACIKAYVFVTSGRCIYPLKIQFTKIIYTKLPLSVKAFIMPLNETKQQYDDVGMAIVNENNGINIWYRHTKWMSTSRTDLRFDWFANYPLKNHRHKVVGYATTKDLQDTYTNVRFDLYEIDVILDIRLCNELFDGADLESFHVPCFHSCSVEQFYKEESSCNKYIGVEGSVVIDKDEDTLIGVATWATYSSQRELPVGFSPINSVNFMTAFECGEKIADFKTELTPSHLQRICDGFELHI